MDVRVQVDVSGDMPPLARVGAHLNLKTTAETVSWFGRGPHENYPDRLASADYGTWRQAICDMHTDYIFPSENGLRCDVSQFKSVQSTLSENFISALVVLALSNCLPPPTITSSRPKPGFASVLRRLPYGRGRR